MNTLKTQNIDWELKYQEERSKHKKTLEVLEDIEELCDSAKYKSHSARHYLSEIEKLAREHRKA